MEKNRDAREREREIRMVEGDGVGDSVTNENKTVKEGRATARMEKDFLKF